jgi:O-Antigen ligase
MQKDLTNRFHIPVFLVILALLMFKPAPGILFGSFSVRIIPILILFISFCVLVWLTADILKANPFKLIYNNSNLDWVIIFLLLGAFSLIISTIIGILTAPETGFGDFLELYRYALYVCFYLIARQIHLTSIQKLIKTTFIYILIVELFGILQFFNIFNINLHIGLLYTTSEKLLKMILHQHRITSTFQNPNMYGSFLIIVVALALAYITFYKKNTVLTYGFITLSLLSVFFTTSRTAVICTAGVIVYWILLRFVMKQGTINQILSSGLIVLGIFVALAFIVIPRVSYLDYAANQIISGLTSDTTSEAENDETAETNKETYEEEPGKLRKSVESVSSFKSRYYYWELNWEKFKESPIFGSGPMKEGFVRFADNAYLYTLARYGVVGLILLVGMYLFIYGKTIQFIKSENISKKFLALAINLSIVGYVVMGMVAEVWYNLQSITILFTIIGLLFNRHLSSEGQKA